MEAPQVCDEADGAPEEADDGEGHEADLGARERAGLDLGVRERASLYKAMWRDTGVAKKKKSVSRAPARVRLPLPKYGAVKRTLKSPKRRRRSRRSFVTSRVRHNNTSTAEARDSE